MKKHTKSGVLQGNTAVGRHGSPYIIGHVPSEVTGTYAELDALTNAGPWKLELNIETDVGSLELEILDVSQNGPGANLDDIVTYINNKDATLPQGIVTAEK